jgi:hypothetical protein
MSASLDYAQRPRLGQARGGHYESWFVRANHPREPRAFWIRYTLFIPAQDEAPRLGEVWAVYFDGAHAHPIAAQEDIDWAQCHVQPDCLNVQLGESMLRPGEAQGHAQGSRHRLEWQLHYSGGAEPLLLLPAPWYERSFPKAKALVSRPLARFNGHLVVDGERIAIDDWIGSENHNWGERHTDSYAWGQVCGFDNDANAFLECASARLKLGPFWSPTMTLAVLRYENRIFAFNRVERSWRQKANYVPGHWTFACSGRAERLHVEISARAQDIVALRYRNPPGGIKTCLNSKLASCELLLERPSQPPVQLRSAARGAFEILTDTPPADGIYAN